MQKYFSPESKQLFREVLQLQPISNPNLNPSPKLKETQSNLLS